MNRKLIKYLIGGTLNTVLSYLTYCLFLIFLNYNISYLLSIISSILISYQVNTRFVFKIKRKNNNRYLFILIYIIQIYIGTYLMYVLVEIHRINELLAPVLTLLIVTPLIYVLSNTLGNYINNQRN